MGEIGISDEMNLHIPQSIEAEVEIMVNSRCANHIVSAQKNGPINGIVQDGLIGSLILTMTWAEEEINEKAHVNKNEKSELFGKSLNSPLKGEKSELDKSSLTMVKKDIVMSIYEGTEISQERIQNLIIRAKKYYPEYIINNDFIEEIPGSLFISIIFPKYFCYTKNSDPVLVSSKPKVLIEDGILLPNSGPLCVKTIGGKNNSIIHDLWKISPEIALKFISDTQQIIDRWLPTHGFTMGLRDCFASKEEEIAKILIQTRAKVDEIIFKNQDNENRVEMEINNELNNAMAVGPRIAKDSMIKGERNALNIMRNSGAKGSVINLAQITAFVGQQNIKGVRMKRHLTHGTRCLPCFLPGDISPEARGFVENNYISGLTPQEAFFHAAAGREGSIATTVRTAETGYIQKRIARKIEDSKVWIDGSVRDANGRIISFMYGDDGMDAKKLISVSQTSSPFFINLISVSRRLNSQYRQEVEQKNNILEEIPRKLNRDEIEMLVSFIEFSEIESPVIDIVTENARDILRKIVVDIEIYEEKIPDFFYEICDTYNKSKAPYGMMVGLIATSSLGEPNTQLTLNSVSYDTKIIIVENNINTKVVDIGEWIDTLMENNKTKIKNIMQNGESSEYLELNFRPFSTSIPTINDSAITSWGNITAITRHPPHGNVIKITTKSGRSVIVSKSKSLLIWDDTLKKLVAIEGNKINLGDLVPIMQYIPNLLDSKNNFLTKKINGRITNKIKEITLDQSTGFIIGVYLSDGTITNSNTSIKLSTYTDIFVTNRLEAWCKKYDILYQTLNVKTRLEKCENVDFLINYQPITKLFKTWLGTNANKKIPPESLISNLDFVKGILDGYFSGNAIISDNIIISSHSLELIEGINMLCARFGIFGSLTIRYDKKFLIISDNWALKFASIIGCTDHKKNILLKNLQNNQQSESTDWLKPYNSTKDKKIPHNADSFFSDSRNCILDPIISIEIIPEKFHPKLYDITVPSTMNFCIYNGLGVRDTFHGCGTKGKDANSGIPAFKQIINATKSKDQKHVGSTIYFDNIEIKKNAKIITKLESENKKENDTIIAEKKESSLKLIQNLINDFKESYVNDFLVDHELKYLPSKNRDKNHPFLSIASPVDLITYQEYSEEWWVTLSGVLSKKENSDESSSNEESSDNEENSSTEKSDLDELDDNCPWVISLSFDIEKLYFHKLELEDISMAIEENSEGNFTCVASPDIIGKINIFMTLSELKKYAKMKIKKAHLPKKTEKINRESFLTDENFDYYICRDTVIKCIKETRVTGIQNIVNVYPRENLNTHEFVMDTDGVNFIDVLIAPGVDATRTICDDMHAVRNILGIEASRKLMFDEMKRIISLDGTYVNSRHISTLVDSMTIDGVLMAASRDGISRDVGPNAKFLFEKNIVNAATSSAFAEKDSMLSLSSSVMYGKSSAVGSGMVVVRDNNKKPVIPPSSSIDINFNNKNNISYKSGGKYSTVNRTLPLNKQNKNNFSKVTLEI